MIPFHRIRMFAHCRPILKKKTEILSARLDLDLDLEFRI